MHKRRIICQLSSARLHAPFTSSSAIGQKLVNPIIDVYFHLFSKDPSKFTKIMLLNHSGVFYLVCFLGNACKDAS